MGGRGGALLATKAKSRFTPQKKQETSKVKEKQGKSVSIQTFIREQTGIDIEKYRDSTTRRFDKKNEINVDWKGMSATDRAKLQQLAQKSYSTNITIEDNGAWMALIRIKKRK